MAAAGHGGPMGRLRHLDFACGKWEAFMQPAPGRSQQVKIIVTVTLPSHTARLTVLAHIKLRKLPAFVSLSVVSGQ